MKAFLQGTSLLFLLCWVFIQCSKTPDTPVSPKSSTKTLTSPTIDGIAGASSTFDVATSTYTVTVPFGTDITALKIVFTLPAGATVKPASGSVQNFTNPVTYTVTAEDGSTQTYTVKMVVTAAPKSSEKQITAFTFAALSPVISATIDQANRKIGATVPGDVNVTALIPTITLSTKATVAPATGVAQNFTNPVSYTVTAEDGSKQTYDVTITKVSTPVSNTACQLTQIEEAESGQRITFAYAANNFLTHVRAFNKAGDGVGSYSLAYNASNQLSTIELETIQAGSVEKVLFRCNYTGSKLDNIDFTYTHEKGNTSTTRMVVEGYVNGYITRVVSGTTSYDLTYQNENLTRLVRVADGRTHSEFHNIEYIPDKRLTTGSQPYGIVTFLRYFLSFDNLPERGDASALLEVSKRPISKAESGDNTTSEKFGYSSWTYEYGPNGYPQTARQVSNDVIGPQNRVTTKNYKFTYVNCN